MRAVPCRHVRDLPRRKQRRCLRAVPSRQVQRSVGRHERRCVHRLPAGHVFVRPGGKKPHGLFGLPRGHLPAQHRRRFLDSVPTLPQGQLQASTGCCRGGRLPPVCCWQGVRLPGRDFAGKLQRLRPRILCGCREHRLLAVSGGLVVRRGRAGLARGVQGLPGGHLQHGDWIERFGAVHTLPGRQVTAADSRLLAGLLRGLLAWVCGARAGRATVQPVPQSGRVRAQFDHMPAMHRGVRDER